MKTINRHGFCHQGIFRVNGLQAELNKLQEAFEAGEDPLIPASLSDELDFDINSIAGLLKVWRGAYRQAIRVDTVLDM